MDLLRVNLIAAAEKSFGIGFEGDLPWKLKNEFAYFHRMTTQVNETGKMNAVIMGRKTYFSNPKTARPFKGRFNIVLSRNTVVDEPGVLTCSSFDEALSHCQILRDNNLLETVWVIGGHDLYKMALESPHCDRVYLTRIFVNFDCDTFFPGSSLTNFDLIDDPSVQKEVQEENGIKYRFEVYQNKKPFEINNN